MDSLNLLVVGECGDGKSTLIKKFAVAGNIPKCGLDPNGVTKELTRYDCGTICGRRVSMIDSPGVGDGEITPAKLAVLIEAALTHANIKVQGVLLTSGVHSNRVTLGANVCAMLVDKGFVGGMAKWDEIILVGTQSDRCSAPEIQNFRTNLLAKLNQRVNGNITKAAVICIPEDTPEKTNVKELEDFIGRLPGKTIEYEKPDPQELARSIADICGTKPEVVYQEVIEYREVVREQEKQSKLGVGGIIGGFTGAFAGIAGGPAGMAAGFAVGAVAGDAIEKAVK